MAATAPRSALARLRAALPSPGQRLSAWLAARTPRTDSFTLAQRNVYILPTRPGWMLGLTLVVMLLGSINYQLNLGYLLTFLLAGSAAVGMHMSHATLRGLTLRMQTVAPCFAGTPARLVVHALNPGRRPRHGIALKVGTPDRAVHIDVPGQGHAEAELAWPAPSRGRHALPTVVAETRYPLGTFRVWTVWRPAATVLVYPAPETPPPPLPAGTPRPGDTPAHSSALGTEFDGVRAYQRGDPLKAVLWKRVAQAQARGSAELVSRDRARQGQTELWLDWAQAGHSTEQRLSRLTAWVLQADRLGLDYGLRLPASEWPPGSGPAHRQQCLEALALC